MCTATSTITVNVIKHQVMYQFTITYYSESQEMAPEEPRQQPAQASPALSHTQRYHMGARE